MTVYTTAAGQAALERFLHSTPGEFDMIFMDVQMPVMDGYDGLPAVIAAAASRPPSPFPESGYPCTALAARLPAAPDRIPGNWCGQRFTASGCRSIPALPRPGIS